MRSSNTNDTAKNLKSKEQANCSNLKATLTRDRAINKMEQCRRSNNISLDQNNCSKRDRSINKMEQCRRSNIKTTDQKHCSTNSANRDLGLINTNLEQTNCSAQSNNYVIPMIQSNCSVQNKRVPLKLHNTTDSCSKQTYNAVAFVAQNLTRFHISKFKLTKRSNKFNK